MIRRTWSEPSGVPPAPVRPRGFYAPRPPLTRGSRDRSLECPELASRLASAGQMGDRPDTECGTEQWTANSRTMGAQCMHRTRIILLSTANHEFTNPPSTVKPIRHPTDQVSSRSLSSFRSSNGVLDRFGALCAQVHHLPTRKSMPMTLQNTEHTPRASTCG
jgi:hypothetical protein